MGDLPGLSGASFYDLYSDPREVQPKMLPMFTTKGMFNIMRARHEVWLEKYSHAEEARGMPFTGVGNARPETIKASQSRFKQSEVPFAIEAVMKKSYEWEHFGANWSLE